MYALIHDSNNLMNENNFDKEKIIKFLEKNNFKTKIIKNNKEVKNLKDKIYIINGNSLDSISYFLSLLNSESDIILYNFRFWHSFLSFTEFNKLNFKRDNLLEIANSNHEIEKIIKNLNVDESSKKLNVLYNEDIGKYRDEKSISLSKSTEKFMDNFFKNLNDGNSSD